MPAITPEEKTNDLKKAILKVKTTDKVDLIIAIEGTPASAHCRLQEVLTSAVVSRNFSNAEFNAANGRITWHLPIADGKLYALSGTTVCVPGNWEAMFKITINGVEKYRDFESYALPATGKVTKVGLMLSIVLDLGP